MTNKSDDNVLPLLLSIGGKKITAFFMADGSGGMGVSCHAARPSEAPARAPEWLAISFRTRAIGLTGD
jgi:hypothetical protein